MEHIPLFLLVAAAGLAGAKLDSACRVGSWSNWSDCISTTRHCPATPISTDTYRMEATVEWDSGRSSMEYLMEKKLKDRRAVVECMADGTCPEMLIRPIAGHYLCEAGIAGDIPCKNVHQMSYLSLADLGYSTPLPGDNNYSGNDVWGWTDLLNGDEYAIAGMSGGTAFVRVTDPQNPVPLGVLYSRTGVASLWRDMKVIGHYTYIVSEAANHGLQVFDLTRLRGVTTPQVWTEDAINSNFGNAHNIVANEDTNYLYVVGATSGNFPLLCRGGLLALDVSNPLEPTYAGCFGADGYTHDAQCVVYHGPDNRYYGREICFAFNENSLTIVDVEEKNNMFMITKTGYVNVAYTHQGWLSEDHHWVFLDDELDENNAPSNDKFTKTYVWDVTDLQNPTLKSVFSSSETANDHNQYTIRDYVMQSNYESGLRILHFDAGTGLLANHGYFDVMPSRTTISFNGAWSVYPYFKDGYGTVLINTIDYGLFIVQPDWDAIEQEVKSGKTHAEKKRTRPVLAATPGATCPPLVETKTCSVPVLC